MLKSHLISLLKKDVRLWDKATQELNQPQLYKLIDDLDPQLLTTLLEDAKTREVFFLKIKDVYVLKQAELRFFIEENKLDNSFTQYRNKIGLRVGNKLLSERDEVVLDWPFKDCVLEGGMTKEDQKRNEVFFNQILAKDEIDRLLEPKALVNWQRYTAKGKEPVKHLKRDADGTIRENLIIKGNNLIALHSLKQQFASKIKLIYIDPPYYFRDQKESDSFGYNTNFRLSTWLTFIRNRLMIAKDLLANDGLIFVQISDDGQAYLKVMMDEIFDNNFLNTISVKAKASSGASGGGEDKKMKKNVEFLNVYCKQGFLKFNDVYQYVLLNEYISEIKDNDKSFAYNSVMISPGKKKYYKSIRDGKGDEIKIFKHVDYQIQTVHQIAVQNNISIDEVYQKHLDKIFTLENAQTSIRSRVLNSTDEKDTFVSIEYTPKSGRNKGKVTVIGFIGKTKRLVSYLSSSCEKIKGKDYKRIKIGSLWDDISWSSVSSEGGVKLKHGKKPEKLVQRVIQLATNAEDIVLDFFLASGTTCAVSHKMKRQYIGVEQLEYEENDSVARLQNVISGDKSGISESVQWKGGGEFVYLEMAKWNEEAKERILSAKSLAELEKLFDELYKRYFLHYTVKTKEFKEKTIKEADFVKLGLDAQKQLFIEMLDMNQLYVNFSERADKKYGLSPTDISLSEQFYDTKL